MSLVSNLIFDQHRYAVKGTDRAAAKERGIQPIRFCERARIDRLPAFKRGPAWSYASMRFRYSSIRARHVSRFARSAA